MPYGWTSIVLHWLSAAAVLILLFAGDSISVSGEAALNFHTSFAVMAWLLLFFRIVWRLILGHPPPTEGESGLTFKVGVAVHYCLILGIALLLASGPFAGWSSGRGIAIGDTVLLGPADFKPNYHEISMLLHHIGAWIVGLGTCAHIAGVLKHIFIDRDDTLDRIMVPQRKRPN